MKRRLFVRTVIRSAAWVPLLAIAGLAASPAALARRLNGFDLTGALIPLDAIEQGGPPRDGIPAIDRPRFVAAGRARLAPDDRVLALAIGDTARAYPVRILNWHEVVNDRFGELPVAVTYCPLCGTGMAFDARVAARPGATAAAQVASFGVSGLLYNSDVLLFDRGTESLWSQVMAQAVTGPLKGTRLDQVPLVHTSWAAWRRRHPGTEVLSTDTGFVRDYTRDPYADYARSPRLMFDVGHRDERLAAKAWVLGLTIGSEAKAWPLSALARHADAQGRYDDVVGGQRVRVHYDADAGSAEVFAADGRPLPGVMAFWFAWVAFHPQTAVLLPG